MNANETEGLTLNMPAAWDSFGQWLVYAILAGMVIGVLIFMFKMIFPGKEAEEEVKDENEKKN